MRLSKGFVTCQSGASDGSMAVRLLGLKVETMLEGVP